MMEGGRKAHKYFCHEEPSIQSYFLAKSPSTRLNRKFSERFERSVMAAFRESSANT